MVVSDTSPLVHLASISHFALLRDLYQRVLIPSAVWRETVEEGRGRPGEEEVQEGRGRPGEEEVQEAMEAGWIEIHRPENEPFIRLLKEGLDDGEAEAIALAEEIQADLLIIDETQARARAAQMGLPLTGTVGVLIRGKTEGQLEVLQPVLDQLRRESLWISDRLYQQVLEAVGEGAST